MASAAAYSIAALETASSEEAGTRAAISLLLPEELADGLDVQLYMDPVFTWNEEPR
jgi:hypothetical protein